MEKAEDDLNNRRLVWVAMSELFLDTELQERDLTRIVGVLAASPYSFDELNSIYHDEVFPVLSANLLSVVGEWAGFDEDWLVERLSAWKGRKSGKFAMAWRHFWFNGTIDQWWTILDRVAVERNR